MKGSKWKQNKYVTKEDYSFYNGIIVVFFVCLFVRSPVKQVSDVSHAKKNVNATLVLGQSKHHLYTELYQPVQNLKHCVHMCSNSRELGFIVSQLSQPKTLQLFVFLHSLLFQEQNPSVLCPLISVDIYTLPPSNSCQFPHYGEGWGGATSRNTPYWIEACKGLIRW